jgi:methylthioribose-1-phosphate isomerase
MKSSTAELHRQIVDGTDRGEERLPLSSAGSITIRMSGNVQPIRWQNGELFLLDQRFLPHEERWIQCRDAEEVTAAIRTMVVRGAPAIGVTAAFGLALEAGRPGASLDDLERAGAMLRLARPTAVNLAWAVERVLARARTGKDQLLAPLVAAEAEEILAQDVRGNMRIGDLGSALLGDQATVLTHCNAGALATGGYGTALGVIRSACSQGKKIAVFAGETRPFLQGARLTAWELMKDGIDVTLITDNMAGHFFRRRKFDAVIVGADRIAANGDVANKIGTYTLAVLAAANEVPFYVAAPLSTIDRDCPDGDAIPIEERAASEVTDAIGLGGSGEIESFRLGPAGVRVENPAFDITPADLISAIITDQGVVRRPYPASIAALFTGGSR